MILDEIPYLAKNETAVSSSKQLFRARNSCFDLETAVSWTKPANYAYFVRNTLLLRVSCSEHANLACFIRNTLIVRISRSEPATTAYFNFELPPRYWFQLETRKTCVFRPRNTLILRVSYSESRVSTTKVDKIAAFKYARNHYFELETAVSTSKQLFHVRNPQI